MQRHPLAHLAAHARHRLRLLHRPAPWVRVAIALATIPVAIVANGLRVAGTGIAAHYYGREAAQGFFHTFSGWLVFVVAFALMFTVVGAIHWLSPDSPASNRWRKVGLRHDPACARPDRLFRRSLGLPRTCGSRRAHPGPAAALRPAADARRVARANRARASPEILAVLGVDDYTIRSYTSPAGPDRTVRGLLRQPAAGRHDPLAAQLPAGRRLGARGAGPREPDCEGHAHGLGSVNPRQPRRHPEGPRPQRGPVLVPEPRARRGQRVPGARSTRSSTRSGSTGRTRRWCVSSPPFAMGRPSRSGGQTPPRERSQLQCSPSLDDTSRTDRSLEDRALDEGLHTMTRTNRRLVLFATMAAMTLGLASCSKDPEVAKQEYVKSGDRFVEQKKYAEAVVQYRNALQQDAQFGEARFKLAETYEQQGDLRNSYREHIRAADALPNDAEGTAEGGAVPARGRPVRGRAGPGRQGPQAGPEERRRPGAPRQQPRRAQGLRLGDQGARGGRAPRSEVGRRLRLARQRPGRQRCQGRRPSRRSARRSSRTRSSPARTSRSRNYLWVTGDRAGAEASFKQAYALDPKDTAREPRARNVLSVDGPRARSRAAPESPRRGRHVSRRRRSSSRSPTTTSA